MYVGGTWHSIVSFVRLVLSTLVLGIFSVVLRLELGLRSLPCVLFVSAQRRDVLDAGVFVPV